MMDFNWAVEQMKQGKKVIRQSWDDIDTHYYYISDGYIRSTQYGNINATIDLFESTDWVLFGEHFDLSKKVIDNGLISGEMQPFHYNEKDIKEFIKELKQACIRAGSAYVERQIGLFAGERFK